MSSLLEFLINEAKRKRINEPRSKYLHTLVQTFTNLTREEHSTKSYLITLLFPFQTQSESWTSLGENLQKLKQLFEELLTCYAVVGIEMHRSRHAGGKKQKDKDSKQETEEINSEFSLSEFSFTPQQDKPKKRGRGRPKGTTKKEMRERKAKKESLNKLVSVSHHEALMSLSRDSQSGESGKGFGGEPPNKTLAGHAHLHIFLTLYNDFMAPTETSITDRLLKAGFLDIDVQNVPYAEPGQPPLYHAKKSFLYCVKEGRDPRLQSVLNEYGFKDTSVSLLCGLPQIKPSLEKVAVGLRQNKIHCDIYPLDLANDIPSVALSSNKKVQITEFLAKLMNKADLRLRSHSKDIVAKEANAKYTYGPTNMTLSQVYTEIWKRLPPLTAMLQETARWVLSNLREFELSLLPTVYPDAQQVELKDGIYDFRGGVYQKTMCRMPHPESACTTFWPTKEFHNLEFPSKTLKFLYNQCDRPVLDFCLAFGTLFHASEESGVMSKPMLIYGTTGTGKSLILDTLVTDILSESQIGRIPHHDSRFQLSSLLNSWISVLNDFTIHDFNHGKIMNILEGKPVIIEVKFEEPVKRVIERTVITTNDDILHLAKPKHAPLIRRLNIFKFTPPKEVSLTDQARHAFMKEIRKEGLGFAILCNTLYLKSLQNSKTVSIPENWLNNEDSVELDFKRLVDSVGINTTNLTHVTPSI